MSELQAILNSFRHASRSEREKGTYFEELICKYLRNEPMYREHFDKVWTWAEWTRDNGRDAKDDGIDLVARERATGQLTAIQCKLYDPDYKLQKRDIDSFFTASGRKPFTHRIIVSTTNHWSEHAESALIDQQPPVTKIDLFALENSQIDWSKYSPTKEVELKPKKTLRDHQSTAKLAVTTQMKEVDRGKLIMACGTGKTFTSLKIAEAMAGAGKRVLFLVPSLALLSQTLTEWTQESETPLRSFAVCSDSDVGKKRSKDDDTVQTFVHELSYPATTNPERLASEMSKAHDAEHMSVVYSTYQSIEVISRAQKEFGLPDFDLIICDEAHRTTGATFEGDDDSAFVRVHDADFIKSSKRLYMTATPKIFADTAKATAKNDNVALYSMDDETQYGKTLYLISFSEAVKRDLLCDYKVIVLAVDQLHVDRRIQALLKEDATLKVADASKIVGCWKALSKQGLTEDLSDDGEPMRRAVAFCQVIEPSKKGKHKVASKSIADMFEGVVREYQATADEYEISSALNCEALHVDGSMNASEKEEKLNWLKAPTPEDTCRILSNVRCLSEGVDVPALDAVLFLTPRNSQVDVVQSVGRVMRKAPGKQRGYIVLPVVIPPDKEPHEALNDNETYRVVWQVLNALRSHDDRFDAMVNKLDLIGKDTSKMEVIAVTDKLSRRAPKIADPKAKAAKKAKKTATIGYLRDKSLGEQATLDFDVGVIERAIYAKLVQKVGNRRHWEEWAKDIAEIAQTHIGRIKSILSNEANTREINAFNSFAAELRDDLNDSISDEEIIEMLAQHLITKPVFDALFENYSFAQNNPMSKAMQSVLDVLNEHHIEKEADTLSRFYESVKLRAADIHSAEGKQKIIIELYDKFFRNAFPKMTDRLGIVYTPVEVVDFILHSVNHLLEVEFGQTLGSEGVHILDPFTGTGTFITRMLQAGLIEPQRLEQKYRREIHANEMVLLAYYIAAINIEATYHGIAGGEYIPFEGICLTDTFQLYEKEDLLDEQLVDNSARRKRQKSLDIRVIVGNPPYSAGQTSANDNNANVEYPALDDRIRETYAAGSTATNKNALYDSYIRAIRWASDRIGEAGVIGFVTNAGWIDANTADGLRKSLADEFSLLHIFHLRGNQRTSGELSRREGGKIFGSGSRAPIAISLLVKNPNAQERGIIRFHDIGDYLSREQKLEKIAGYASIAGIGDWRLLTPDMHGDWLNHRDNSFSKFIAIGSKSDVEKSTIFKNYSNGLKTQRDPWAYNASRTNLASNMRKTIEFYNAEVSRISLICKSATRVDAINCAENALNFDSASISWTRALKHDLVRQKKHRFDEGVMYTAAYRPFTKRWLYFSRAFNEMVYQIPKLFPLSESDNLTIVVTGNGARGFSCLMTDKLPDVQHHFNGQCFPRYLYEIDSVEDSTSNIFRSEYSKSPRQQDGISDEGLKHFVDAYPNEAINKDDIFYYIYGILHSQEYRDRYSDNLGKELPRIPRVKTLESFHEFAQAGRKLAELHVNYENVQPYDVTLQSSSPLTDVDYRVTSMKFGKKSDPESGKTVDDRTVVIYNDRITLRNVPEAAWNYIVNGKSALEWVMERQSIRVDKASGIVNDANEWATETAINPRYPLELFCRIITVSLETIKIVNSLPSLKVHPLDQVPESEK